MVIKERSEETKLIKRYFLCFLFLFYFFPTNIFAEEKKDYGIELICFGATWCEPCQKMKPILKELYKEGSKDGWRVYYIDVEKYKNTTWVKWHNSRTQEVPHLVICINRVPWIETVGFVNKKKLFEGLENAKKERQKRNHT